MRTIPHREQLPFPDFSDVGPSKMNGSAASRPCVLAAVRSARAVSLHGNARYRLDILKDSAALDARLRSASESAPSAMIVELHPDGPGPVGPLVRTLTRHFPGVPLIVACTERAPDGREVLGAARAGAELFAFPPDDNLAALVARLVGDLPAEGTSFLPPLPRLARRMLGLLTADAPLPPPTVLALADHLSMNRRTLCRRMHTNGWPAPRQVLIWGRLLRGARSADEARTFGEPLTSAAVAAAAGFGSAHGAAQCYRRYADVTLSDVRSEGMQAIEPALILAFPPHR